MNGRSAMVFIYKHAIENKSKTFLTCYKQQDVIVKFVQQYGEEVHYYLAGLGLAPFALM